MKRRKIIPGGKAGTTNNQKPLLRSMRARMTLGFALVLTLLMTLIGGGMTWYLHRLQLRSVDELLTQSAQEVSSGLGNHLKSDSALMSKLLAEGVEMSERKLALFMVDQSGRVLMKSQKRIPDWPLRGDDWRVRKILLPMQNRTIFLAAPWHETETKLREFVLILSGLSALMIFLASLGAWILVGRTLWPIGDLSRQAAASSDDLLVHLEAPSNDHEMSELVNTLNDFLRRQSQAVHAKGRFYAAASHELRTPLQALSGFLEVGLSRERTNEELRTTLKEAQEQSRQLGELVQDLLLLNQLDMATARPPAQEVDIPDVIERFLKQWESEISERALQIETDWTQAKEINAPWNHLEMLARNLVENAVKYASDGGRVSICQNGSTLSVRNQCAPIVGWDKDKYFEPFFRPDVSRNSQTGGNGLGLAICKAICQSNHWQIEIKQVEGGVLVTVDF